MEKYQELRALIMEAGDDADKFYVKNNKAAGTRLRKAMLDAKQSAQAIRLDVVKAKND
jgi:hypothetical protein